MREREGAKRIVNCKVHKFLYLPLTGCVCVCVCVHPLKAANAINPHLSSSSFQLQSKINAHFCVISLFTYYITHKHKYTNTNTEIEAQQFGSAQLQTWPTKQPMLPRIYSHTYIYLSIYLYIYYVSIYICSQSCGNCLNFNEFSTLSVALLLSVVCFVDLNFIINARTAQQILNSNCDYESHRSSYKQNFFL